MHTSRYTPRTRKSSSQTSHLRTKSSRKMDARTWRRPAGSSRLERAGASLLVQSTRSLEARAAGHTSTKLVGVSPSWCTKPPVPRRRIATCWPHLLLGCM
eukprot:01295_6